MFCQAASIDRRARVGVGNVIGMRSMAVQDTKVIVLPDDGEPTTKGALFERFVAKLLAESYGFDQPSTQSINVTADGIELDVVATHRLTGGKAIAECKAYSRTVKAAELAAFYGKLAADRLDGIETFGVLFALPRLTADGGEKAREIASKDRNFRYLSADDLATALRQSGLIANVPETISDSSDPAVVITEHGLFAACIVLDRAERTPTSVAVWGSGGTVPQGVRDLIAASEYAGELHVFDAGRGRQPTLPTSGSAPAPLLATVAGSSSDFEYQLPASPRYFVGRRLVVERLEEMLAGGRGQVVVLNAQSGWGKSSLALKLGDLALRAQGVAAVLDARTADHPRYVVDVLRLVASQAVDAGILELPLSASWASLDSALATLQEAKWHQHRPVVAFFDQFENVFRDVELTRAFRNLALGARDINGPLLLGFAWKTDLVGWTEGHPYQLRDDIRGAGAVVVVEPFGPREVEVILGRIAKQAEVRLHPDLRSRVRAYSQGLPWLLKKLADHVLRELRKGVTQEELLAESLNVVGLFEADLAELSPSGHEVLRHIAKFAPIPAAEVTERFGPDQVQSLVDRRLIVQVGDRLDTYWDTFRDFLNTGTVPVQESWILRQTPRSVGRLLSTVFGLGGDASVRQIVELLDTSDTAIFNLSRELRLLGITSHEPNRVRLVSEVVEAEDPELEVRRRVGNALRRHRAFSALRKLADRSGGSLTLDSYARDLPNAFPAVAVAENSWRSYARAFLFWMDYAGLVVREGGDYRVATDHSPAQTVRLLDSPSPLKYRPGVPLSAPRRSVELLNRLHLEKVIELPSLQKDREAAGALYAMGALTVSPSGQVRLKVADLILDDGQLNKRTLRRLLEGVPGGQAGVDALVSDPRASPKTIGTAIASAAHATWTQDTLRGVGGYFRSWCKLAGLTVEKPRRGRAIADESQGLLI
jgi:hypothetical protein